MAKAASSAETTHAELHTEQVEIDLKDPFLAAFLAWLIPGAGHWYQGRRHKAALFFVWIMGTFVFGLYLGEGRVVYASWRENDRRLPYLCQVGVGLPAMPALIQASRKTPFHFPIYDRFMVPPNLHGEDSLDSIQKRLHHYWELGGVYTMIAGLLNILAIYDAWGGPALAAPAPARNKDDDDKDNEPGGGGSGSKKGKGD